jgi:O-acetylhomoserine/O-acetylserine sulfhydrylase-like pyridoxal-dependent enzyme
VGGRAAPFESFAFAAGVTTIIIIMVQSYCEATSKVKWLAQVVL